jgi:hypothetical protein
MSRPALFRTCGCQALGSEAEPVITTLMTPVASSSECHCGRALFDSLYRRHPVGGLLVWTTESKTAAQRGNGLLASGVIKLLLDGQQRITTLYGVVGGRPPKFFDGNAQTFTGLRFHLESEA